MKIEERLKELAFNSELIGNSKHSTVIVKRGRILAEGRSKLKTHPLMLKYQPNPKRLMLHSEIDAIVKYLNNYGEDFSGVDLYNFRLTKGGNIGCSKPCKGCMNAILDLGIDRVYWTEYDKISNKIRFSSEITRRNRDTCRA